MAELPVKRPAPNFVSVTKAFATRAATTTVLEDPSAIGSAPIWFADVERDNLAIVQTAGPAAWHLRKQAREDPSEARLPSG